MVSKLALLALLTTVVLLGLALGVAAVGSETCTSIALVGGLATPYANVRDLPLGTPIAKVFPGDTPAPADASRVVANNTWWHLCGLRGWVRGDVVNAATLTPSASPTRLGEAQTNIAKTSVAKTLTPTPNTQPRITVIEGENGVAEVHITCPVPCEVKWIVEELP